MRKHGRTVVVFYGVMKSFWDVDDEQGQEHCHAEPIQVEKIASLYRPVVLFDRLIWRAVFATVVAVVVAAAAAVAVVAWGGIFW